MLLDALEKSSFQAEKLLGHGVPIGPGFLGELLERTVIEKPAEDHFAMMIFQFAQAGREGCMPLLVLLGLTMARGRRIRYLVEKLIPG